MLRQSMNIGVVFAGGVGTRMRSRELPKQFLSVHGKPVIIHTLEHFEKCADIDAVVVACVSDRIEYLNNLLYKYRIEKVKKVVPGGETGQLSIYNGLKAAEAIAHGAPAIVLIHDGVRPFISGSLLSENIKSVKEHGSAITAGIVKETITVIDDDGMIKEVPDRAHSRVAKAPQSFWLSDILDAHNRALSNNETGYIDSCTLMQAFGAKLHTVDGPYENIKITTPDDYYTMRAMLDAKEDAQIYGLNNDDD